MEKYVLKTIRTDGVLGNSQSLLGIEKLADNFSDLLGVGAGFLNDLNEFQIEMEDAFRDMKTGKSDTGVFEKKDTIPLYFVNLVLQKYSMRIIKSEETQNGA